MFYLFRFLTAVVCISSHVCCDSQSLPLPHYVFCIFGNAASQHKVSPQCLGVWVADMIRYFSSFHFAIMLLCHLTITPFCCFTIVPVGHFNSRPFCCLTITLLGGHAISPFCHYAIRSVNTTFRHYTQVCYFASTFCSWTSKNGSMVIRLANKISFRSLVWNNF